MRERSKNPTNTNRNPHATHNKHTQRERVWVQQWVQKWQEQRDEVTIVYRLKLAAVMLLAASPAIALSVCVCRLGCVRERERASTNFITSAMYACAWATCVCVLRDTARHVRNYWRATGCCIICAHRKWAAFRIRFRFSLDSIRFDYWSSVDRRARFAEEVDGSNEPTRLLALLYILIGIAKVERAQAHKHIHTRTGREMGVHTHSGKCNLVYLYGYFFNSERFARHTALWSVLDNRLIERLSCVWGESWIWTELGSCLVYHRAVCCYPPIGWASLSKVVLVFLDIVSRSTAQSRLWAQHNIALIA